MVEIARLQTHRVTASVERLEQPVEKQERAIEGIVCDAQHGLVDARDG